MEFFDFANLGETIFLLFGNDVYKQFMWAYLLIGGVCFAVVYAFQAIGLYRIASREGYDKKWMAFVPILNTYYIGVVADKNKVYKFKAKHIAIVAAVLELAYVVLATVYYIAQFLIFDGNFAVPEYEMGYYFGAEMMTFTGYSLEALPHSLEWAGWVFAYFEEAFLSWLGLLNLVANVLLMIAFFQTYACKHYVLFAIFAIIFPIKGILIFAVRNNSGKNYMQYVKEKQQRQYQQYQEYMRQHGGYNNFNPNGPNPYGGSYYGGNSAPQDPFDGMGANNDNSNGENGNSSSGNSSGDPFEDF